MAEWRQRTHGDQYFGNYSAPQPDTIRSRHSGIDDHDSEPARRRGIFDRPDAHPRTWLLLIPIVLPLTPTLYNRVDPALMGIPFFYWSQLGFAFLASGVITYLHRRSR
ncbi:DUF3311 domain-containing protein [Actinoplanes couchii]|uniref:DUF3311 domain-containing protein n=1 Tax=Actinoplanes couchii TaxID=403638 RepID=A0ABQ3XC48_9ACTN|nr:DUF3311 domain-containing protein [Actinoplanes couchii]MDR6323575.1 hypothetical protein [Actinoplanes couchii]GID56092.1 hypothetical protein Aco03nite_044960 [Actinoplanes couchii]